MSEKRPVPKRRMAREAALQVIYGLDLNPMPAKEALRRHRGSFGDVPGIDDDSQEFFEDLVSGVAERRAEIDRLLADASRNWRLSRMAAVDRNLLRLAAFELMAHPEIPARVTLNEAVELAKTFGSTESRSFVNGVLDRVAALLEREGRG